MIPNLPTDSSDYDVITRGVSRILDVPGMTCEIGLRRGGGTKYILDALVSTNQKRTHVAIDPYGNIDYEDGDSHTTKYDYTNEMRDECLVNLYSYARQLKQNVLFFNLEDTEFFSRYADGIPVYQEKKRIESLYAFIHFDGPHSIIALRREIAFFEIRSVRGAVFVFDDVENYDHTSIDRYLTSNGWLGLDTSTRKWSYMKRG